MTYYCTFGHGQPHFGCYIKVEAESREAAIKFMNERFRALVDDLRIRRSRRRRPLESQGAEVIITKEQMAHFKERLAIKHSLHPRIVESILQSHEELREALQWADGRLDGLVRLCESHSKNVPPGTLREILGPVRRAHIGNRLCEQILDAEVRASARHEAQVPINRRDEELDR